MKTTELIEKKEDELRLVLREKKGILRDLRFKIAAGSLKNVREFRKVRKEIAQVMTVINNKKEKIK